LQWSRVVALFFGGCPLEKFREDRWCGVVVSCVLCWVPSPYTSVVDQVFVYLWFTSKKGLWNIMEGQWED
jgi:hypothetical protein